MDVSKYNTFLFDWDGCLGRTLENWLKTYEEVYSRYGICVTRNNIINHSWGNLQEGPKFFGLVNYDEVWKEIVDSVTIKNSKVELYPLSKELLLKLKGMGKKICVVTSSERKIVLPAISHNGLESVFDFVITEEDVSNAKPDPEIINLAIEKCGGKKSESIVIGDTAKDILAGHNAGIDSMLVLHKENSDFYDFNKMKESNPTYIVEGFEVIL